MERCMKRFSFFCCLFILLLTGVARAASEGNTDEEASWKANFRRIGLELSSTNVSHADKYQDSTISQLSADGQAVVKGVFDFALEYTRADTSGAFGITAEYGKTRLEPYNEPSETNETADKILIYSSFAHKAFDFYSASFGPMANVEYQTEFTRNGDTPRTRLYRGKTGLTIFDGAIVKGLYLAAVGEYDVTYSDHVSKLAAEAGWAIEYKPEDNLTFSTDGYYRRYLAYSQYVPEDLRYDLSVNARMDASLNGSMSLGPFLSYRRAHSRSADVAGSNFTIGVAFTYKNVFNLN